MIEISVLFIVGIMLSKLHSVKMHELESRHKLKSSVCSAGKTRK